MGPTRNWPRHNRQGIHANDTYPADFLYDNLAVEANVIHAAWRSGVRKRPFLGSTCIYPKLSPQPLREEYLLTGPLEPTNEWYAVGKIAGIKTIAAGRRSHKSSASILWEARPRAEDWQLTCDLQFLPLYRPRALSRSRPPRCCSARRSLG